MRNLNTFALVAIVASVNKCSGAAGGRQESEHLIELTVNDSELEVDESLISHQFHEYEQTIDDSTLICDGEVSFIRLNCPMDACDHHNQGQNGMCEGCKAYFCHVDFNEQKNHPEALPTFSDIIGASRHCDSVLIEKDFNEILNECKQYDANNESILPKALPLTGLITELGFTDSILVTNAITLMSPNVRMLVEPQPVTEVMTVCDNYKKNRQKKFKGKKDQICNRNFASKLLEDVVFMLSRSIDNNEDRMILKAAPSAVEGLDIFVDAFPQVNWIYIYDDPVAAIGSQMATSPVPSRANCVKTKLDPPPHIVAAIEEAGYDLATISLEEYCAAYLAMLSKRAVEARGRSNKGTFASSESVMEMLPDILTNEFGVEVDQSSKYTGPKDRNGNTDPELQAKMKDKKVKKVTGSSSDASTKIYGPIFSEMENLKFAPN